jgi:hypothetical protein
LVIALAVGGLSECGSCKTGLELNLGSDILESDKERDTRELVLVLSLLILSLRAGDREAWGTKTEKGSRRKKTWRTCHVPATVD